MDYDESRKRRVNGAAPVRNL